MIVLLIIGVAGLLFGVVVGGLVVVYLMIRAMVDGEHDGCGCDKGFCSRRGAKENGK